MELDSYGKFSRGLSERGGLEEQEGGAGGKKGLQKTQRLGGLSDGPVVVVGNGEGA